MTEAWVDGGAYYNNDITVISTWGTLLSKFQCLVGPLVELLVSQVKVNKFFFSVAGALKSGELIDAAIQEVNVKKKITEVANKKLLLVGATSLTELSL